MKYLMIFLIILFGGCSTIPDNKMPSTVGNDKLVQNIIKNYKNLYAYLNDTNISDYSLLRISHIENISEKLTQHIVNNKFHLGYKIIVTDSVEKTYQDSILYYWYELKCYSTYNNEIIWFGFVYDENAQKWKLNSIWYCNNPIEMIHYGEPCDKKVLNTTKLRNYKELKQ